VKRKGRKKLVEEVPTAFAGLQKIQVEGPESLYVQSLVLSGIGIG
jgi:hypothetical protein